MDVKKKIMFVLPSLSGGGAERVMLTLVKHIDKSKFVPIFVLNKKEGKLLKQLPKDIEVIDLNVTQARYAIFKIAKKIKELKPDIVFSTLGHLNLLMAMIRPFYSKKIKFISRESNTVSLENQNEKYPRIFNFLYKNVYNNFDLIITQSKYMKLDLVEKFGIKEDKIVTIYNPVDIENILEKREKPLVKPFKKDKINLIAIGRLAHQKGFDVLIDTMANLDDRFHLYILGEGDDEKELKNRIKTLDLSEKVTMLGFCENPYAFINESDFFILSSRYEGLPNVVLEANACKKPCVAFDMPGGTAEIIVDGKSGILVKHFSAKALSDAIKEAVKIDFDEEYIYNFCKENFSVLKIVREYENNF